KTETTREDAARLREQGRRHGVPDWSGNCSLDPALAQRSAQQIEVEQPLLATQAQDLAFAPVIVKGEKMDLAMKIALAAAELPVEITGNIEEALKGHAAGRTDEIKEDFGLRIELGHRRRQRVCDRGWDMVDRLSCAFLDDVLNTAPHDQFRRGVRRCRDDRGGELLVAAIRQPKADPVAGIFRADRGLMHLA